MGRIAVLGDELINQIAAGEVVERPASVVKELTENALDAGATAVRVRLRDGGLSSIEVGDDGHGMSPEDARACLGRHATSKLRSKEDLFSIGTLGFRGEAIPSIASVSRFELVTSTQDAAVATRVRVTGGGAPEIDEAAPVGGTVVRVDDLFFNLPARRKFLRRAETELRHCQEAVLRIALANPGVSFHLEHEGRALIASPGRERDALEGRVTELLGERITPHLLPVEERRLGIAITGFVASPEHTLPNARGIHTYVNGRYVRDRGLNHALQRAYRDLLPHGRQPVTVLFIQVGPEAVDVNVHPQKLEVRFSDAQGVGETLVTAVKDALMSAPWMNQPTPGPPEAPEEAARYQEAVSRFLRASEGTDAMAPGAGGGRPWGRDGSPPKAAEAAWPARGFFSKLVPRGALGGRLWLCEGPGASLVVVDGHAALERVRLAVLTRRLEGKGASTSQRTLGGGVVELPSGQLTRLLAHEVALGWLGIHVEAFGEGALRLERTPEGLESTEPKSWLEPLAEALPAPGELSPVAWKAALGLLACRSARRVPEGAACLAILRSLDAEGEGKGAGGGALHGRVIVLERPFLELIGTD